MYVYICYDDRISSRQKMIKTVRVGRGEARGQYVLHHTSCLSYQNCTHFCSTNRTTGYVYNSSDITHFLNSTDHVWEHTLSGVPDLTEAIADAI